MQHARTVIRTGLAAVALVGFAGLAEGQSREVHVLTVPLPGGGVEQIRYTGDVAPQVYIVGAPMATMQTVFGPPAPFAELDRISAEMDRQASWLLRRGAVLAAASPAELTAAATRALPAGSQGYSFVSTMTGDGVCTRSVEITSQGNGGAPRVVIHTSGNCARVPGFQVPAQQPSAPA